MEGTNLYLPCISEVLYPLFIGILYVLLKKIRYAFPSILAKFNWLRHHLDMIFSTWERIYFHLSFRNRMAYVRQNSFHTPGISGIFLYLESAER